MKHFAAGLIIVLAGLLGGMAHAQDDEGGIAYDSAIVSRLVAEGLVTPIEHTQAVNGIETSIDWVYADVAQVIVCLTLHDLDPGAAGLGQIPAKEKLRVVGPDGVEFETFTSEVTITNAREDRYNLTVVTHFYPQDRMLPPLLPGDVRQNYFAGLGSDLPATVYLQLKLDVEVNSSPATWTLAVPDDPAELTLPVTATLHHGISFTPPAPLDVNGQTVTLRRLTMAPSQTLAEVCYEIAGLENWQPVMRLFLDSEMVLPRAHSNRATQAPGSTDPTRCFEAPFDVVYLGGSPIVDFAVEFLYLAPADPRQYWEMVRAGLVDDGINVMLSLSGGTTYEVLSVPDGMNDEDVYQRIRAARLTVTPTVDGPWVFMLAR